MAGESPEDEDSMAQADPPDNVVRFPREWFGSTDDLVPIEPAASPRDPSAGDPPVLAGSSFWTEDSWALQDALERPVEDVAEQAAGRTAGEPVAAQASVAASRIATALAGLFGVRGRTVAAAALVAAFAFFAWTTLTGGSSRSPRLASVDTGATPAGLGTLSDFASSRFVVHRMPRRLHVALRRLPRRHVPSRRARPHPARSSAAAPQVSYVSTTAPSTSSSGSYTTSTASTTSSGSSPPVYSQTDVTQPAFGASGALGPGHSPNG